jgi:hypothetical protein
MQITTNQRQAILEIGALFAGSLPEDQQARKASEILDHYCGKRTTWAQEEAILDAAETLSASVGPMTAVEQLLDTALLLQEGKSAPNITAEEREFYANLQFGWDEEKGFYLVPDSDTLVN